MKLICKNCNTEVDSKHINLNEGVASCQKCSEFIPIAGYLQGEEEITRIEKPSYSDIEFVKDINGYKFLIPPDGWTDSIVVLFVMAVFWNYAVWFFFGPNGEFSNAIGNGLINTIASIPFLLGSLYVVLELLFTAFGTTIVMISKSKISVTKSILGIGLTRTRETNKTEKIIIEDISNDNSFFRIKIFFDGYKRLRFAYRRSDLERRWIIGELKVILDEFNITGVKYKI